jgi:tight adherence protein C
MHPMILPDYIMPVLCAGAISVATYAILVLFDPYWMRVRSRVGQLQQGDHLTREPGTGMFRKWEFLSPSLIEFLERARPGQTASRSQLQRRLTKAGIYHPSAPSRYIAAKVLLSLVAAVSILGLGSTERVRMDVAILFSIPGAVVGALLPSFWLDRAIAKYHLRLRKSLPDFLDLMTVCLEGGMSLQETIRRVSDELQLAHPSLAAELSTVQRDIELGSTVDQALKRFATRTENEGVRTLSTFIRESQRFGTSITEALRSHADMLRMQREQSAEENAQKASVKILLPTLLLIFPAIFVVAVGPALIQIQEAFAAK